MISRLKNSLLLSFIQKKHQFFILSILAAACFLFTHAVSFAITSAARAELVRLSGIIEGEILPTLALEQKEQKKYMVFLTNLRTSDNSQVVKKSLTDLITCLASQKAPAENPAISAHIDSTLRSLILIQADIRNEPILRLQEQTKRHFMIFFGDRLREIEFHEKTSGVQLGRTVVVTLKDVRSPVKYYVKTHRGGLLSPTLTSGSAGPKPVDPKELFVYKVFELIGVAPEVHFFFDDTNNFYIATKDAGFDESTQEQRTFLTYESLKGTDDTSLNHAIGKILSVSEAWDKRYAEKPGASEADALEKSFGTIELNIIKGLSKADILSRIFLLTDFTTNVGNIGFVMDEGLSKFRVIDFVISETGDVYRIPGIFAGFLSGNGRHRYAASVDGQIRYVLHARHLSRRVQTAREAMLELTTREGKKALSNETFDEAGAYVKDILRSCPGFSDLPSATRDLDDYVAGVKFNLGAFKESLASFSFERESH